ncbi:MAG TPA: glycosyltransferase family 39 protein [Candidatus Limnocylindria bacterium]|nr:glycosyltransferase family 39 protein [Candidatus Limnocylindria bacterium]
MNRRDVAVLFMAALALRGLAAVLVGYPPYTDPAYYLVTGQQLAHGGGFTTPVLWSFLEVGGHLPAHPSLPVPSNGHWMPLTQMVAALGIVVFGPILGDWHAAQVPFVLLSALLVPFTYVVGWELWRSRMVALGGAVLALLAGPFLVLYPQVNNIAVFGAAGAGAVWCAIRAVDSPRSGRWLIASGALAGVATLARVDGLLVLLAPVAAALVHGRPRPVPGLAAVLAAFVVVMLPWWVRDLFVFGALFPSAGGHTLWITTYNQQFSISTDPSLGSYLAWGLPNIIGSKLAAWGELVGRVAVLLSGIFVVPFTYGLWAQRRRRALAPFLVYFAAVFVIMGLVFTFHAPKGAFYHSAAAWLPFAFPLAVASLAPAATAAGRWWHFLARPATHRFLLVAGLAGAVVLSLTGSAVLLGQWSFAHDRLALAAGFLESRGATSDRVLAYDPAALHALSGNPGVAPPFDPFAVIDRVVDGYGIRWVVVTLSPGETRDPLGLWDGASGVDSTGAHPAFLPDKPAFEAPGVRVFEVRD